jgi:hypothetical protein
LRLRPSTRERREMMDEIARARERREMELKIMRAVLVALAVLLATMVVSPAATLAHVGGPTHGNTYAKKYFPAEYFRVCHPDGSKYYGKVQAAKRCNKGWTGYAKQFKNGRAYYRVGVHYDWKSKPRGEEQSRSKQYYCQFHKYDDPNSKRPRFQCQVTNGKTNKRYWQRFDHYAPFPTTPPDTEAPNTRITTGDKYSVRVGTEVSFHFYGAVGPTGFEHATDIDHYECRSWGFDSGATRDEALGKNVPWGACKWGNSHTYVVSDHYHQTFEVRAVDHAGNVDPTPGFDHFETYNW